MKDAANLFNSTPEKGDRATGWYIKVKCNECQRPYVGDKKSVACPLCTYGYKST